MRSYRTLLITYLAPLRGQVSLFAVLLFAGVGLQVANPQIVRHYIDVAREGGSLGALAAAGLAYLAIALGAQLAGLAETYIASNVGWRATNALRADLVAHCLGLDLAFHNARTPGELIERVDGDVATLASFFSRFVLLVVGSFMLLLGILVLVAREDRRVGLLFLAFSVASLTFSLWARRVGARYALAQRQASAELFGFLEERLNALPDIQANGSQAYVLYRAQCALRALFQRAQQAAFVGNLLGARWLIDTAGWVATLALLAALFRQGETTLGTVYLLVQYRSMVNRPLSQIVRQIRDLQQASASIQRVRNLLATSTRIPNHGRATLPPGPLSVDFDHVSFAYPESTRDTANPLPARNEKRDTRSEKPETRISDPVLHNVSFSIRAGRVLGLLGRTGSGKTTLARLLFRLYDSGAGTLRVGGFDVRDVTLDSLRTRVGLVTQEVQLFRATVRDNLTLFDPCIPDAGIVAALADLGLAGWLTSLPSGLDTQLGSDGAGLSAGQSQLLAFARVFLRNPGVVVLDEASSRLDPATERLIEAAVARLLGWREPGRGDQPSARTWGEPEWGDRPSARTRTAIVIAHRLETVQRADDILILEDGAVAEYGRRTQLAADPTSRFAALLRAGSLEAPPPQRSIAGAHPRELLA
ncbi:MAG: ABC transporter ATP-binding protein [Chloroflexi bacterium]|nr:ABC transporter ATP-binding protein [Chloroflexota bacterium]